MTIMKSNFNLLIGTLLLVASVVMSTSVEAFQISIKRVAGPTMTLDISPNLRWSQVKQMIENKTAIPAAQQRLIFNGADLQENVTVQQSFVTHNSVLFLLLKNPTITRPLGQPVTQPDILTASRNTDRAYNENDIIIYRHAFQVSS